MFGIWFEFVSEVFFEVVQLNLKEYFCKSDYLLKFVSLVGDYFNKLELFVYDQQVFEYKELMFFIEMFEDECVFMLDLVERVIDQISN